MQRPAGAGSTVDIAHLTPPLAKAVGAASGGAWKLGQLSRSKTGVTLQLQASDATLRLDCFEALPPARWYREVRGVAFAYQTPNKRPLTSEEQRHLDAVIEGFGGVLPLLLQLIRTPAPDPMHSSAPRASNGFPSESDARHLESFFALTPEQIETYRRDGFVVLRGVLDPAVLEAARPALLAGLERNWPTREGDEHDNIGGYARAFAQITNVGQDDAAVRAFTQAPRIGQVAAQLMGVPGVRVYCEDWLIKRPGDGPTGWHQDACVFPFSTSASATAWIPLVPVPEGMGLVQYARGSHKLPIEGAEQITAEATRKFAQFIEANGLEVVTIPPCELGDICIHNGWTLHGALGNESTSRRDVLALHLFADGAQIVEPANETMRHQLRQFGPGLRAGDAAASPFWPRIYPKETNTGWSRLRTTVLPEGVEKDLWIHEGRFRLQGPADAPWLASPGGFALSGLVDAHCHLSWPHTQETPSDSPAFMNANRQAYGELGVTALRDMGSDRDAVLSLPDQPGLPTVLSTGVMLLRDDRWPLTNTPPEKLKAAMLDRLAKGARWVKVFADFSADFQGRDRPGFYENDAVTYPLDVLADAVSAVHAAGGRVAAHCFSRPGAEVSVAAGVDSLEHGWGLDEALLERMVGSGTAWIPLLGIARPMLEIALQERDQKTQAWVFSRMDTIARLLPLAVQLGVPVFAGTDWFPNPTVVDEQRELLERGLSVEQALAAGTFGTRRWLGLPGIEEGARADIVLYQGDPRRSLDVLDHPELVIIGGARVQVAATPPTRDRRSWAELRATL